MLSRSKIIKISGKILEETESVKVELIRGVLNSLAIVLLLQPNHNDSWFITKRILMLVNVHFSVHSFFFIPIKYSPLVECTPKLRLFTFKSRKNMTVKEVRDVV